MKSNNRRTPLFAVALALALGVVASAPARAVEPLGVAVLALITIGTHVLADQVRKGNLKAPPEECKSSLVKSATGGYYYQQLDVQGDCTYTPLAD